MDNVRKSWKLQEFVAHKANVNCLAMGHKSNQVLATGGDDKKVNLWAIGRHSCLMSLPGHTTPVECVCFSHSEDLVSAGSQTGALKIWDLEAAKVLRNFTGHKGAIKCIDFHPYGDYLTSGSCDNSIKLWDSRKRGCIVTYKGHRFAVNSLQFSPDGQWIASACDDGVVKVWDVRMGKVLKEFHEHKGPITNVKFHPHEFLLSSCGTDKIVNFWDMETFSMVSKFNSESLAIKHIQFSNDGSCLLGVATDGLAVVGWEPARCLDSAPVYWPNVSDMTMAHDQLIVGSFHSTYVMLSVVDLKKIYPFSGVMPAQPITVTNDQSPFQKGHTVRKSFSKERPVKEAVIQKTMLDDKMVEESTSSTDADDDQTAVIQNFNDYSEIFRPSRACLEAVRPKSPPSVRDISCSVNETKHKHSKELNTSRIPTRDYHSPIMANRPHYDRTDSKEDDNYVSISAITSPNHTNSLFKDTTTTREPVLVFREATENTPTVTTTIKPSLTVLNRQHSYKESSTRTNGLPSKSNLRVSTSEVSLGVPSLGPRSLSFSRPNTEKKSSVSSTKERPTRAISPTVEIYSTRPAQSQSPRLAHTQKLLKQEEYVSAHLDRPVGLDLDEFMPKSLGSLTMDDGLSEPPEQEVLSGIMRGHTPMMTVLTARQRSIQIFHSVRVNKSLKAALESTIALNDVAVLVDILNIMAHKPSLWNLDICMLMLPKIHELLQSKYESYITCGCQALRLILRNFAGVVKTNVKRGCSLGVDLTSEERYNKCVKINNILNEIRAYVLTRQAGTGAIGRGFRDLLTQIEESYG